MKLLTGIGRLFTAGAAGIVPDAAVAVDGDHIAWAGPAANLPATLRERAEAVDLGGALVTPGLIDAHTHPVYAGSRFAEIAMRSAGASYAELGETGGIKATMRATRAAAPDELEAQVAARLARWPRGGATTVEAKTGYHLERDGELAAVRLLTGLRGRPGLPDLAVTFLGAHAVPPEAADQDAYTDAVASWCPAAREAGATFADVFCDQGYFTIAQTRRVAAAAMRAGLTLRLHADELARTGGAALAADLRAASADHLLLIGKGDAAHLAAAGVVATLAPCTAMSMKQAPPARALLDAGATIALGTDHNPGTCGATDMSLVVALAVAVLGLSVDEAVTAATSGGAASLRLADRGRVEAGLRADLVAWDADHEGAFAWSFGLHPGRVWLAGTEIEVGVNM